MRRTLVIAIGIIIVMLLSLVSNTPPESPMEQPLGEVAPGSQPGA